MKPKQGFGVVAGCGRHPSTAPFIEQHIRELFGGNIMREDVASYAVSAMEVPCVRGYAESE